MGAFRIPKKGSLRNLSCSDPSSEKPSWRDPFGRDPSPGFLRDGSHHDGRRVSPRRFAAITVRLRLKKTVGLTRVPLVSWESAFRFPF